MIHDIAAASAGLHATGEAPGRRTDAVYLARLAARAVSLYACAFALTRSVEAAGGKQHPLAWAPLLAVVHSAVDGAFGLPSGKIAPRVASRQLFPRDG